MFKTRPAVRASLTLVGYRKDDDEGRRQPPAMRSVSGTVASSKPISISKAAVALSSFVAGGTGASRDVAAYVKRASLAFDDLVLFHRDLRARRRSEVGKDERSKKEKGVEEKTEIDVEREALGDGNLTEVERDGGEDGANGEKEKRKWRVKATGHGQAKEQTLETDEVSSESRSWKMKQDRKDEAFVRELEEEEQHGKKRKKKKIQAD